MNKNIEPYNDKGKPHGYWEYYWDNGELAFKCIYINGELNGFVELHNDLKIKYKYYYL